MKKYYQLIVLAVPLLFLAHICSVSAASGIAAYYVDPGDSLVATLDGNMRVITNTTSYTIFISARTLEEQQSFLNNLPAGVKIGGIKESFDSLSGWTEVDTYGPGVSMSLDSDTPPGGGSYSVLLSSSGTSGQGHMVKNFPEMPNYDEYKFTIWAKVKANGYGYSYGWMLVQDALDCTIGGWNGGDYNIYIYGSPSATDTSHYYPRAVNSWLRLELTMNTNTGMTVGEIYDSNGSLVYSDTCTNCTVTTCGPPSRIKLGTRSWSVIQWWKYDEIFVTPN